ncbi:MAG: zinc-dependent peptidase [Chitinophagaceae bacterium]|nr:zinc-dependent peptidase [Chitinophagaceae bacterium]
MFTTQLIILTIFVLAIFYMVKFLQKKKVKVTQPVPPLLKTILQEQVPFYQQLNENRKTEFEERTIHFLTQVKVTGVKTVVEDLDRVLIAASAIIPIFNFQGWEYPNLNEVLLYPDSFDHEFEQQGDDRNILGMVGSGALNQVMILSQFELRQAFINETGKNNTAIHEFVHLVDKTDGEIDGVPESLLNKQYIKPWLQLMQEKIKEIIDDRSDINPYGATNEAEFFAVVSEYFFERPELLKEKHPELYELLLKIFHPEPVSG